MSDSEWTEVIKKPKNSTIDLKIKTPVAQESGLDISPLTIGPIIKTPIFKNSHKCKKNSAKEFKSTILTNSKVLNKIVDYTTPENIYKFFDKIIFTNSKKRLDSIGHYIGINTNEEKKSYIYMLCGLKPNKFENVSMFDENYVKYIDKMNYINLIIYFLSSEIQMYIICSYCITNNIILYKLTQHDIDNIIFEYIHYKAFKTYSETCEIDTTKIEHLMFDDTIKKYVNIHIDYSIVKKLFSGAT
jgi:hypothetical protein